MKILFRFYICGVSQLQILISPETSSLRSGDVWLLGQGGGRQPVQLRLKSPGRVQGVAACTACTAVSLEEGAVLCVWGGGREERVGWGGLGDRVARVLRMCSQGDTLVAHLEMK